MGADPLVSSLARLESVQVIEGPRGPLTKLIPHATMGEVYLVELIPGIPRGGHLHAVEEEFVALSGAAWLFLERDGESELHFLEAPGNVAGRIALRVGVPAGVVHTLWAAGGRSARILAACERRHPEEGTEERDMPWVGDPRLRAEAAADLGGSCGRNS